MSTTPRTDALCRELSGIPHFCRRIRRKRYLALCRQLEAELAELRKDKARLDWIPIDERKPEGDFWYFTGSRVGRGDCCSFFGKTHEDDGWPIMRTPNGHRLFPDSITHWMPFITPQPPRAAIDAAIAQRPAAEK